MNTVQKTANTTNNTPIRGRTILKALGIGVGIALPVGLATGLGLPRVIPALSGADWLATIIAAEVYLALITGHVVAFGGIKSTCQRLRLTRPTWRDIRLACLVFLLIWGVAIAAYLLLQPVWGLMHDMGQAVMKIGSLFGRLDGASPVLLVAALIQPVLLTPLMEELVWRGSLFGWLRGKLSAAATILITSALFAMFHPLFLIWPIVFLFGLGAGWIRERTGSITPFLIMHILNSIMMITAAYFLVGWHV